jgi:hypothetical protein
MRARKRSAVEILDEPRRRSGRRSSAKTSSYFEGGDSDDDTDGSVKKGMKQTPTRRAAKKEESEHEDDITTDDDDSEDDFDEDADEGEVVPVKRRTPNKANGTTAKPGRPTKRAKTERTKKEAKVENDGSEDEDSFRRVTIIPIAQLRDTAGVEYADERLHKNTMLFLKDLKANNNRPWLKGRNLLPSAFLCAMSHAPSNAARQTTTASTGDRSRTGSPSSST